MSSKITCFNRDLDGVCLAVRDRECTEDCPYRFKTLQQKIDVVNALLKYSNSKKDQIKLHNELTAALRAQALQDEGKYEGWMGCYYQDTHRGEKGGASESDSNARTSMKQLMKDNRAVETKLNSQQQVEYKEELRKWEEENEKLERLGRSGTSRTRIDSYTGVPVCFVDNGIGTCKGMRSAKGNLKKECKNCDWLKEGIVD